MTPREALIAARALIADEANWTRQVCARNAAGDAVFATSPDAVCFCAIGAVQRAVNYNILSDNNFNEYVFARNALEVRTGIAASAFNDTHTHSEVLAMFDKAIQQ